MDQQLTLDVRAPGTSVARTGYCAEGDDWFAWQPHTETTATLKSGSVDIHTRITKIDHPRYSGEVTGFSNWEEESFCGLRPGSAIDFTEDQIFVLHPA